MIKKEEIRIVSSHIATVFWDILFGYGFAIVFYGYLGYYLKVSSLWLDSKIVIANFIFTCLSVIITCISIYFKETNEPSLLSKRCSSPMVIGFVLVVVCESILRKRIPNNSIQTGIAIMGISGALHQLIPRLHEKKIKEYEILNASNVNPEE